MSNQRFTKGVFNCAACGRATRGDATSAQVNLCTDDYELAGWYNSYQDGNLGPDDFDLVRSYIKDIRAKGGTPDGDAAELTEFMDNYSS